MLRSLDKSCVVKCGSRKRLYINLIGPAKTTLWKSLPPHRFPRRETAVNAAAEGRALIRRSAFEFMDKTMNDGVFTACWSNRFSRGILSISFDIVSYFDIFLNRVQVRE